MKFKKCHSEILKFRKFDNLEKILEPQNQKNVSEESVRGMYGIYISVTFEN